MKDENPVLPDDVLEALQAGQAIEAIKRLRAATGLGLKEAKDVIDGYPSGNVVQPPTAEDISQLPASVVEAIRHGNKIEAIKLLREQTGLGLKEAKDAVDASDIRTAGNRQTVEKPRTSGTALWLAVFALLGYAAYYFLHTAS